MILDTPISAIMTKDVFIVGAGDPLHDVAITFNNHDIRHAPVTSKGFLVGMLSWVDLKKVPAGGVLESLDTGEDYGKLVVGEVMTRDPVSVQASDTVGDLAEILSENEFHAVPVLEGNRIVGIVSTTDLIRFFLESLTR
ncbi:MAG: CBS domain-containing protein [Thermoanaerobaculia bacterium]|nr:CBS domain-containing protein [Thermoanaerobaculia bacterium]